MEFWIDVGGTFTDCMGVLDDGRVVRHKVLSSGVTKGRAAAGSDRGRIVDPARQTDPAGFWHGYIVRMFDQEGRVTGESRVASFDAASGVLELASPLPELPQSEPPLRG
jgi:5-oxoprolinase (ATP-hydrolysing)